MKLWLENAMWDKEKALAWTNTFKESKHIRAVKNTIPNIYGDS